MPTDRELMQQALDALLEACGSRCNEEYNPCWQRETAEALRARLAQPDSAAHSADSAKSFCKPKPVAWDEPKIAFHISELSANTIKFHNEVHGRMDYSKSKFKDCVVPVYFAPPRREWQGITDEERQECYWFECPDGADPDLFAERIEAKPS